jgi:uncharacterized metal-binding protein YceD (DUF177 family)
VKFLRYYNIDVIKLKEGHHSFSFDVKDEFFRFYEADDWVDGANLTAKIEIEKTSSVMEVSFLINGTVALTCDRSLEIFDQPITVTEKVLYKYGPVEEEISEDVFMITKDTAIINVAQLIYEFILLAIPAKRVHPDYIDEMDEDEFEGEGSIVYRDGDLEEDEYDEDESEDMEDTDPAPDKSDPRWDILKNLKQKE